MHSLVRNKRCNVPARHEDKMTIMMGQQQQQQQQHPRPRCGFFFILLF